jgi:hypothetical protein
MDDQKQNYQCDSDLPPKLEFENAADSSGLWFAAAVVFAVIAAGIIVYRTATSDPIRTAANDPPAAARADPTWPSTILPPR